MSLGNLILLKIIAVILSDNIVLRIVIFLLLIFEMFKRRISVVKNRKDLLIGCGLIVLNTIINVDFSFINFIFLGVFSSVFSFVKMENFINYYFILIIIEGCVIFCLNL